MDSSGLHFRQVKYGVMPLFQQMFDLNKILLVFRIYFSTMVLFCAGHLFMLDLGKNAKKKTEANVTSVKTQALEFDSVLAPLKMQPFGFFSSPHQKEK